MDEEYEGEFDGCAPELGFWFFSWFTPGLFWAWNVYERYLWPGMFRHLDSRRRHDVATEQMGKWVYEGSFDHHIEAFAVS